LVNEAISRRPVITRILHVRNPRAPGLTNLFEPLQRITTGLRRPDIVEERSDDGVAKIN